MFLVPKKKIQCPGFVGFGLGIVSLWPWKYLRCRKISRSFSILSQLSGILCSLSVAFYQMVSVVSKKSTPLLRPRGKTFSLGKNGLLHTLRASRLHGNRNVLATSFQMRKLGQIELHFWLTWHFTRKASGHVSPYLDSRRLTNGRPQLLGRKGSVEIVGSLCLN